MKDRPRGAVAVFLIAEREEGRQQSVDSFQTHTPPDVELSVVAGGTDLAALTASVAPADVVLVQLPCVVAAGWLEGLRDAAHSAAEVASALALSTSALPAGDGGDFPRAAAAVRSAAAPRHPRCDGVSGPCRYIRRSAIELAGEPGPDFARHCLEAGLAHVIADDVLVAAPGRAPAEPAGPAARAPAEPAGPAARALGVARRAVSGLSVIVDARILDGPTDGTRVHVLELIAALARSGRVRVTAIVPERLDAETRAALELAPHVELEVFKPGRPLSLHGDVVHRPVQISADADLTLLGQLADRLVITHQDLISYHNPAYFPSVQAWVGYRAMTARALRAADRTVFFSAHVRDDAVAQELVEPHRASIVPLGVDHAITGRPVPSTWAAPGAAQALAEDADREVILCLGTDFLHKNRVFALRLVQALQRRHAWSGRLVLAGPRVAWGSSREQEHALQADDARLAAGVIELDAVSETEKHWLLARASLVLYPTVHEGFGLVPFEAAAHGRPCLWAAGTALSEILPDTAAAIVAWDAEASADRALALMREDSVARANLDAVAAAGTHLRWDQTAERLIAVYHGVCDAPPAPAGRLERAQGLMREGLSEDAMRLVGPGGALPRELERPLLALATHRRVGGPVLAAIRAAYRASLLVSRPRRRGRRG